MEAKDKNNKKNQNKNTQHKPHVPQTQNKKHTGAMECNTVDNIILNLKILGQIKKTDKLCCNDNIVAVHTSNIGRPLSRWWYSESRDNTIKKINLIIDESFKKIDEKVKNYNSANSELLQRFLIELTNACSGLNELKISYIDDINMQTKLDLVLDKIRIKIVEINKRLKPNTK